MATNRSEIIADAYRNEYGAEPPPSKQVAALRKLRDRSHYPVARRFMQAFAFFSAMGALIALIGAVVSSPKYTADFLAAFIAIVIAAPLAYWRTSVFLDIADVALSSLASGEKTSSST